MSKGMPLSRREIENREAYTEKGRVLTTRIRECGTGTVTDALAEE